MVPMSTLKSISPANRFLLWTLVRVALADGEVSPVEQAMIDNVVRALKLDQPDRELVRQVLLGTREIPPATTAVSMPKYEHRLIIFKDALDLAFSDGVMDPREHHMLGDLFAALHIKPEDRYRLWHAAKAKYVDTP